jgi:hypothetical protein
MIPFGKQQEISRDLSTSSQKCCQETAGSLFIEDGVVVISNESRLCSSNWLKPVNCPRGALRRTKNSYVFLLPLFAQNYAYVRQSRSG